MEQPQTFKEFVGNEEIIDHILGYIKNIKAKKSKIEPMLFIGLPGTGKTTLSRIIANELKFKFKEIIGADVKGRYSVPLMIRAIKQPFILSIDEIHSIEKKWMETLYPIFSDKIVFKNSIDGSAIFGSTTEISLLPAPLRSRFVYIFELGNYTIEHIKKIISNRFSLATPALDVISRLCQLNPRQAINIAITAMEIAKYSNENIIDTVHVIKARKILKLNEDGLLDRQVQILQVLKRTKFASRSFLVSFLQINPDYYEILEPYLIKSSLISINSRGRFLTEEGSKYVDNLKT